MRRNEHGLSCEQRQLTSPAWDSRSGVCARYRFAYGSMLPPGDAWLDGRLQPAGHARGAHAARLPRSSAPQRITRSSAPQRVSWSCLQKICRAGCAWQPNPGGNIAAGECTRPRASKPCSCPSELHAHAAAVPQHWASQYPQSTGFDADAHIFETCTNTAAGLSQAPLQIAAARLWTVSQPSPVPAGCPSSQSSRISAGWCKCIE